MHFLILSIALTTGNKNTVLPEQTSPPTATILPVLATALGANAGRSSATFWLERIASTTPISATNTVESAPTAMLLGCAAVEHKAGLQYVQYMIGTGASK